jgi:hypothetical protein
MLHTKKHGSTSIHKNVRRSSMKTKTIKKFIALTLFFFSFCLVRSEQVWSESSAVQEKSVSDSNQTEERTEAHPKKGGIYKVGRAFKTAGHGIKKGGIAAGHGIKKGAKATGHAFEKAGSSIKHTFTGESKPEDKSKLDHVGEKSESHPK